MDATTVLAVLSCITLFVGWLILPHGAVTAERAAPEPEKVAVAAT